MPTQLSSLELPLLLPLVEFNVDLTLLGLGGGRGRGRGLLFGGGRSRGRGAPDAASTGVPLISRKLLPAKLSEAFPQVMEAFLLTLI